MPKLGFAEHGIAFGECGFAIEATIADKETHVAREIEGKVVGVGLYRIGIRSAEKRVKHVVNRNVDLLGRKR